MLHLSAFVLATGMGWGMADGNLSSREVDAVWLEAVAIARRNARALCVLVAASLTTGGFAGLCLFGINGYAFGTMLGMAPAAKIYWVLLYAPIEVSAFTVASVAATRLSWAAARWLRGDASVSAAGCRIGVTAAGVACALAAAAFLEALAIRGAWSDD
ncbi:MAG: stage II sporulation protein M [Acidobacteria bacterium]|nr:stage II sporulation protein M [Acidobacteriota bacterium]